MHDDTIILPNVLAYGGITGPRVSVSVVRNAGGYRKTNRIWSQYLRRFTLSYQNRTPEVGATFLTIWEAIGGPAGSFLGTDPNNWNTTDGIMGSTGLASITNVDAPLQNVTDDTFVGDGSETDFRMFKFMTSGTQTHQRRILKPRQTPEPIFAVDGSPVGFSSIDYATGIVTLSAAPANLAVPTWGGAFYVPMAFVGEDFDMEVADVDAVSILDRDLEEVRLV